LKELTETKVALENTLKSENFNDNTGIGESKNGLPLGRLAVRIVSMDFPQKDLKYLGDDPFVRLRISIKGIRSGGPPAGPPIGPKSYCIAFQPLENVPINEALGPFAPIRTQDANVLFELVDMRPEHHEKVIGTTMVHLNELKEQDSKDLVLSMLMIQENGDLKPTDITVLAALIFQYSKIAPIRISITNIQNKLRLIEKELSGVKASNFIETSTV
jgi:hypothetical protein